MDLTPGPEVYAAAAAAMVPFEDDEQSLWEWHHCFDNPNCRGATEPCPCSGRPWPSEAVRLALVVAYRAGREDAVRDIEAASRPGMAAPAWAVAGLPIGVGLRKMADWAASIARGQGDQPRTIQRAEGQVGQAPLGGTSNPPASGE